MRAFSIRRTRPALYLPLFACVGEWRSLVARLLWEQDVAGSNPVSPTIHYFKGETRMPTHIILIIVAVIVVVLLVAGIYVVQQQYAAIIERFGKYHRTSTAGIHVRIPLVDRIAAKVPLRIQQLDQTITTKTRDNVFVSLSTSVQYRVDPANIEAAYYELQDPEAQISSYIEDNIRNAVPNLILDEAFVQKDKLALDVEQTLKESMSSFGYIIIKTLVTDINPSAEVRDAMNAINEAERKRVAAKELAEADKITMITRAEAEATKNRLHGEGIAAQRQAIIDGLRKSLVDMKQEGLTEGEVMSVILTQQYLDTMNNISASDNTKVLMMPSNIDAAAQIRDTIIQAHEADVK